MRGKGHDDGESFLALLQQLLQKLSRSKRITALAHRDMLHVAGGPQCIRGSMLQPGLLPKSVMELKEPQVRDSSGCRESSKSGSIVGDVMGMSKLRYQLGIQACCFWVPLSESNSQE